MADELHAVEHDLEGHDGASHAPGAKHPAADDAKGKKQHRDNMILIVIALGGLILTYLLYKSRQGTSSVAGTVGAASPQGSNGLVAGAGSTPAGTDTTSASTDPSQAILDAISQQGQANDQALSGFEASLASLLSTMTSGQNTASTNGGTTPTGPTPTNPGASNLPALGAFFPNVGTVVTSSPGSPGQPASVGVHQPGSVPGAFYTVSDTNQTNAGGAVDPNAPVIPPAQRIPGERYNSKGQVIA